MDKKSYYKASNWNAIEDQVDCSTRARSNDIAYESRCVPIHKDRDEFSHLPKAEQTMPLHSFGSLVFSSTLQMKVSLSGIRQDAENFEETAVYSVLQYLKSINNRTYGHALSELSTLDEQRDETSD